MDQICPGMDIGTDAIKKSMNTKGMKMTMRRDSKHLIAHTNIFSLLSTLILISLILADSALAVEVTISPMQTDDRPIDNDALTCIATPPSVYVYRWYNSRINPHVEGNPLPASYTQVNDVWTCKVFLPIPGEPQAGEASVTIRPFVPKNNPPVADADGPYYTVEGIRFLLHAFGSYDVDRDELEFRWDFESDGNFDTQWDKSASVNHTYKFDGTYLAKVEVRDTKGAISEDTSEVFVGNSVPLVGFIANTSKGQAPLTVKFSSSVISDNLPVSYSWDFQSDNIIDSHDANPVYTFLQHGTYTVVLKVTDTDGDFVTSRMQIVAELPNRAPFADADGPYNSLEGMNVVFDASSSRDPDGESLLYRWYPYSNGIATNWTSNPWVVFNYPISGTYTATLEVKDPQGLTDTDTSTVIVANNAPIASIQANSTNGTAPLPVAFSARVMGGNHPLAYEWDFESDGIVDSTAKDPIHTFRAAQTYLVNLAVTDSDADKSTSSISITVLPAPAKDECSDGIDNDNDGLIDMTDPGCEEPHDDSENQEPTASFYYIPQNPSIGQYVTFISNSTDPDGNIVSYVWDFNSDGIADATGQSALHSFGSAGEHHVRHTVIDAESLSDSVLHIIEVARVNRPPIADAGRGYVAIEGVPVLLDASESHDPDADQLEFRWDFESNGIYDTGWSYSPLASFAYSTANVYLAKVEVRDSGGLSTADTAFVFVGNNAPSVVITANSTNGTAPLTVGFSSLIFSGNQPFAYAWDFESDGIIDSHEASPFHTFFVRGNHNVTLTIMDADGDVGTSTIIISVHASEREIFPPVATIVLPANNANFTNESNILFFAEVFDPDSGTITSENLQWRSNVSGRIGSGYAFRRLLEVGSHLIILTATDPDGLLDSDSVVVNVRLPSAEPRNATQCEDGIDNDNDGLIDMADPGCNGSDDDMENQAPHADFIYRPQFPTINDNILFTSISTDPENNIVSYSWDFDSDGISDAATPAGRHKFEDHGTYNVTLTVTDAFGQGDSETKQVNIIGVLNVTALDCFNHVISGQNQSCSVFVKSGRKPVANATVAISYTNGTLFGKCRTDRITGGCNVIAAVGQVGTYTLVANAYKDSYVNDTDNSTRFTFMVLKPRYEIVNLAIYNDTNFTNEDYDFLRNQNLYVKFQVIDKNNAGKFVPNIVTKASLVSPPGGIADLAVFQNFSDGWYYYSLNPIPASHNFLGESQIFTFAYNFSDNSGGQKQIGLTIRNNPPRIIGPIPSQINMNTTFTIDLTPYEFDIEDSDTNLTWLAIVGVNSSQSMQPVFAASVNPQTDILTITILGSNQDRQGLLTLVLYDLDLDTDSRTIAVNISSTQSNVSNATGIPPRADPNGPYSGMVKKPVSFDGSASVDDVVIVYHRWDFGDGSIGFGVNPVHTYTSAGNYTVTLTVKDNEGLSSSAQTYALIQVPKPFDVSIDIKPKSGRDPLEVIFQANPSEALSPVEYIWDFGDGTSFHRGEINQATHHIYRSPGMYQVTLTAINSDGSTITRTETVSVGKRNTDHIPRQRIYIDGMSIIGDEIVSPGSSLDLSIAFENEGERMRNAKITVSNELLGILATDGPFRLGSGDETERRLTIEIPKDAKRGEYLLRVSISDDKVRRIRHRSIIIK